MPDVARTAEEIGYESLWVHERACSRNPRPRAARSSRTSRPTPSPASRSTTRDGQELKDVAAEVYEAVRTAGN
ncbi:hypothetical protein ABZ078_24860 [Streptomyces sp. NPDC006385]|uniref:hypothetical protein n=1 Tax=Streptomyces sp. NPDC006385 TaxID=3156761 RepID=UPI0033B48A84